MKPILKPFQHIETISAEASQTLKFIGRTLRDAPPHVRKMAYETSVTRKLEYAATIWRPHQSYLVGALEPVQTEPLVSTYLRTINSPVFLP